MTTLSNISENFLRLSLEDEPELGEEQQDALEQDMAPFGFIVDGLEDENIGEMVDEYGTRWSPVVRDYRNNW